MRSQLHQVITHKPIRYFLAILILFLFYLPFWQGSFLHENYTGILNDHNRVLLFWLSVLMGFCILFFLLYTALSQPTLRIQAILIFVLSITALIIPYGESQSVFSTLHLAISYGCFIWINWILFKVFQYHPKTMTIYIGLLILVGLIALTFQSINGLSEWLYFSGTAILLLWIKK